ncbi:putative palmitoyltransferase ZDHHC12 [Liparis tanakae]|uniref:Putative palmitoyltransferase ZDHHC12 n=1 Tax=Liparis tanakae TaxID=230148 RepID=A0A4Z2H8F0_9TELE|nr:putative palmitoyltransferase ZDHHC12 [Liparis tanakae]
MFKNVFGSGFLVRTAHVVLTWVTTLILFLHDTVLRKQEESGQLVQPVLFVLLVLVSVLLYFSVSLMDPGFILCDSGGLQVSHGLEAGLTLCTCRVLSSEHQNHQNHQNHETPGGFTHARNLQTTTTNNNNITQP